MAALIFFYIIMNSEEIQSASLGMERKAEEVVPVHPGSLSFFNFATHKIFPVVVDRSSSPTFKITGFICILFFSK